MAKKLPLTDREKEIVQLVVEGYRNQEIANKLFISERTVKCHLYAVFKKLRIHGRQELTASRAPKT